MKFAEEYSYNCINIKKYFRIPVAVATKSYLMNDGRNSIVKMEDQKLLHSWTLEHPYCFTTPVVFNSEDSSLFCITDNITLLKFSLEDDSLKNASKFQFQEEVFCVLPLKKHKPLILFSSGKILLTELIYISQKPVGTAFIGEDEELVWADALVIHAEIKVVCLTTSKSHKIYKLHSFSVKKENVTDYRSEVIENAEHTLHNWCLDKYNFAFITIWSNGIVLNHCLFKQTQSTLFTHSSADKSDLLAVSVLDADHIIVAKSNRSRREAVFEMWDTKFAAIKARKVLKATLSNHLQIDTIKSSIFVLLDENLLEVPFFVEKSTLAAALGKSTKVFSKLEYSWNDSTLAIEEKSPSIKTLHSAQDLAKENENLMEPMDSDETTNQIASLAQRFIEEGSTFKTNNRESDLLDLLRFALKAKSDPKERWNFEPDVLLNAVFTSTFREAALVQYVKKLSLKEAVITLEILLDFLEGKMCSLSQEMPSDSQLLDWIFIIMKSHTEALLLSKDKKKVKLLKKLDQLLSEKTEVYEDYGNIQSMFYMLQKKENILPTKHVVGKYFIETLEI